MAPPKSAPILEEGWQPGGAHPSFAAGFNQAVRAHVGRLQSGGYEICDSCGCEFDPVLSGHPTLCGPCANGGD